MRAGCRPLLVELALALTDGEAESTLERAALDDAPRETAVAAAS
ncbi:hypothetical protein [Cellulomonas sp. KRMCY2]|nr:hypothetical protein [Cellulomonas sp. KRMCY2]